LQEVAKPTKPTTATTANNFLIAICFNYVMPTLLSIFGILALRNTKIQLFFQLASILKGKFST
jgi:hypothetical protein